MRNRQTDVRLISLSKFCFILRKKKLDELFLSDQKVSLRSFGF